MGPTGCYLVSEQWKSGLAGVLEFSEVMQSKYMKQRGVFFALVKNELRRP